MNSSAACLASRGAELGPKHGVALPAASSHERTGFAVDQAVGCPAMNELAKAHSAPNADVTRGRPRPTPRSRPDGDRSSLPAPRAWACFCCRAHCRECQLAFWPSFSLYLEARG